MSRYQELKCPDCQLDTLHERGRKFDEQGHKTFSYYFCTHCQARIEKGRVSQLFTAK